MNESNGTNTTQVGLEFIEFYVTIEVLIAIFALFNNTLVLVAICKYKHLHTSTYWMVASLAFADIGVATLAIPSGVLLRMGLAISNADNETSTASVNQSLCLLSVSFVLIFTQVSIFSLLIIAIDRFIAIYYSLRYKVLVTSIRIKSFIAGAWILGALIGLIPQAKWLFSHLDQPLFSEIEQCSFEKLIDMESMVYINSIACTFLPLVIMFVLYCFIFKSANEQLRKIYCDPLCHHRKSKSSICSLKEFLMTKRRNHSSVSLRMRLFLTGRKFKQNSRVDDVIACDCNHCDATQLDDSICSVPNEKAEDVESKCPVHSEASEVSTESPRFTRRGHSSKANNEKTKHQTKRKQSTMSTSTCCSSACASEAEIKHLRLKRRSKFIWKEFHAARSLSTVVGVFALCWLPLHIHNTLVYFNPTIANEQPGWVTDFAILLSHANSLINPIIYAFHLREMKKAFRKIMKPFSKLIKVCF